MEPQAQPTSDMSLDQAMSLVMKSLPKPLREFLVSEERNIIARELSEKYSLHIDQAGEFERSLIFLLLGVTKPEDFVATLGSFGLSPETITALVTDVNNRVFIPLRAAEYEVPAVRQAVPPVPNKPAPLPPPTLDYQPPATLPGSPVIAPMPSLQEVPPVAPHLSSPSTVYPQALDQSEPLPIPSAPSQQQSTPLNTPQTLTQIAHEQISPPQTTQQKNPITHTYSADPYREPLQ